MMESITDVSPGEIELNSSAETEDILENATASQFATLYKNTGRSTDSQNERRHQLLTDMKRRRKDLIDCKRGINDVFDKFNDEENMEVCTEANLPRKKKKARMAYKLMLSEWFMEIPEDLEDNWLLKICPVGVRNLIIADRGKTKVYSRYGEKRMQLKTLLPGGSMKSTHYHCGKSEFTILDCIWERERNIYFVLDVIAWGTLSLMECDAEFRFYWLQSKFQENSQLGSLSEENEAQFYPLPHDKACRSVLQSCMSAPFVLNGSKTPVDGLLFYHKDCHYLKGFTPLVGWLKPFMLPSELGVEVCEDYLVNVPMDFVNLENYLENKKTSVKKNRNHTGRKK